MELIKIELCGDKLIVSGDLANNNREFYLPDCSEDGLNRFIANAVSNVAPILNKERPWKK